jgi:hypothetical protein
VGVANTSNASLSVVASMPNLTNESLVFFPTETQPGSIWFQCQQAPPPEITSGNQAFTFGAGYPVTSSGFVDFHGTGQASAIEQQKPIKSNHVSRLTVFSRLI